MRKFLFWLQARIKSWIKPATPVLIIDLLSDLTHSRTDLIVENVLLRQQLILLKHQVKRPPLSNPNRIRQDAWSVPPHRAVDAETRANLRSTP